MQPLWTRLRLATQSNCTLWISWRLAPQRTRRCRAATHQSQAAGHPCGCERAARVASRLFRDCGGAIQRDLMRVSRLVGCDMAVPLDWLRGRCPFKLLAHLQVRWCHRDLWSRWHRCWWVLSVRLPPARALGLRIFCAHPHGGHWLGSASHLGPHRRRAPGCSGRHNW